MLNILNREDAENLLKEAELINPGPWVMHSIHTAKAAEAIARVHPRLDPEKAYILGCLHDIGRMEGITKIHHIIAGYSLMKEKGYEDCSKICLTHSFLLKDTREILSDFDCTLEEIEFIKTYINSVEYDDYDYLIQLCDFLALPEGPCLLEKRIVEEAFRKGINDFSVQKWKRVFEIKETFEKVIGKSIYSLLPGIIKNTFEFVD